MKRPLLLCAGSSLLSLAIGIFVGMGLGSNMAEYPLETLVALVIGEFSFLFGGIFIGLAFELYKYDGPQTSLP